MSYSTNKKTFNIDSSQRSDGSVSNFEITLRVPPNEFTHVSVVQAEIAKSWNMVDGTSDFVMSFTDAGGTDAAITISAGNYNAVQLGTELQTQLNASGTLSLTYTVAYDSDTNRYTISAGGAFTITYSDKTIYKYFGFSATQASAANAVTSDVDSNLQRYDCIAIRSNMCKNFDTDELAFIYPNSYAGASIISYVPTNPTFTACTAKFDKNQFRFSVTDANTNKVIDLDGVPIRLTVCAWKE